MPKIVKLSVEQLAKNFCAAVEAHLDGKKPKEIIRAANTVSGHIDGMLIQFTKFGESYQPFIKPAHLKNPTIDDIDPVTKTERFELQYVVASLVEGMPETYKDLFAAHDAGAPVAAEIMKTADFEKLSQRFGKKNLNPRIAFFVPMQADSGIGGFIGLRCQPSQS